MSAAVRVPTMKSTVLSILSVLIVSVLSKKVVVKYFGEDFLVDGGCSAKDETVLRWHKFCSSIHGNSTLCITDTFGNRAFYYKLN